MLLLLRDPPRPSPLRLVGMVVASVLAHGLIFGLFVAWGSLTGTPKPPRKEAPRPVSMRRIDSKTWAANRATASARASAVIERPVPMPKGQIVDVEQGNNKVPTESNYLAESNNTVTKETRAKNQVSKWSRATAKTTEKPEALPSSKGSEQESAAAPIQSGVSLAESMLGRRDRPSLLPQQLNSGTGEGEKTAAVGTEGSESGPASTDEGGGAPNDALDVPEGDGTYLNTREFRYASFFNRVKQAISAKWDPSGRLRAKNRSIGYVARTTVMNISLRPDGSIADLFVARSSGMEELDVEAMNAVQRAGPFANPPAALVRDGYISFSFTFQVTNEGMVSNPFRFR
ncbi:MAG: hypothetical protein DI536_13990 [Archangium gephyra]|uniref:Energy transducer TonB n=1 Tax=Archangium gephyra TaxID=48 RepID=A0A2W5TJ03_9BACT|nr:MAG: hypothetical protein DI536_13990 [Archangium gephyra]